jgi:hypothetical protein
MPNSGNRRVTSHVVREILECGLDSVERDLARK